MPALRAWALALGLLVPRAFAAGGGLPPGCGGWRSAPDLDNDGVAGDADACPDQPEDPDGFDDDDGCPDRDNDGDGVPDPADLCPLTPEDADGVLDGDGCPDRTGRLRLLLSAPGGAPGAVEVDARPMFGQAAPDPPPDALLRFPPGAPVQAELSEGPWVLRVRAEGLADASLKVEIEGGGEVAAQLSLQPLAGVARLRLDLRDPRGVPVSGAVVRVGAEAAPLDAPRGLVETTVAAGDHRVEVLAPGHAAVVETLRLAPGELRELQLTLTPLPLVSWQGDRLVLREPVRFVEGTDALEPASFEVVQALARWLLAHPEVGMIRVEVHTDGLGDADAQLRLSQRQAEALVQALVDRGVPRSTLHAVGFGGSVPLATSSNQAGRSKNRRVEFVVEASGAPR